jgi:LuxR family maltose regulon positive regulatory protein
VEYPVLPDDQCRRPRLSTILEGGQRPIVVVVAPAGFGKTTAVAEWLMATGRRYSWLSFEEHDDDLLRFFSRLAAALKPICGRGRLHGLVSSASGLAAGELLLAEAAMEDLGAAEDGFVVVLDDLHKITDERVHRGLQLMVDHIPADVTLAMVSRTDPPVALARLRVAGRLTELRTADLAFNPTESEELLSSAGQPLSASMVARLNERIEGWAVGLRMAAMSMTGSADVEEFVASFSGDERFVADYLLEEVLDRETERVQRFLLESSLLEEMTPEICDAALDMVRSGEVMEDLFRRNVFVVRVGSTGDHFRYHELFADLLRARVHRRQPERTIEVLRTAAAWCERTGDLDRALRYLIRAGDVDAAATLAVRRAPRLLMQGDVGRHQAWLRLFPVEVVQRVPGLLLTRAWSGLFADRPSEALRDLAAVERIAPDGFLEPRAGELELIRAIAAWFDGRHIECIEHGHRSLELLAEDNLGSRCVSHLYCGVGELVAGESHAAVHELDRAVTTAERIGNEYAAFSARVATGALHIHDGDLGRAQFFFRSALDMVDELITEDRQFPIAGSGHLGCGIVSFEQLELDPAIDEFRRAVADLRKTTAVDYISLAYRLWAEAKSLQGHNREAVEILDEARRHLSAVGTSRAMVQGLDDCEARLALRAGDLTRAVLLHERSTSTPQRGRREFDDPQFDQLATAVRLAMAGGHPEAASGHLPRLSLLSVHRAGPSIETAILEATVHDALGNAAEVSKMIDKAVALAAAEGWVRLLVDVDPAIAGRLQQMSPTDDVTARHLERVQTAGDDMRRPAVLSQSLVDPLTARELEVLAEVAAGLTNAEIADRLYISVGTTKRHVANIFVKLPAKHRAEAIARARTLGIIP